MHAATFSPGISIADGFNLGRKWRLKKFFDIRAFAVAPPLGSDPAIRYRGECGVSGSAIAARIKAGNIIFWGPDPYRLFALKSDETLDPIDIGLLITQGIILYPSAIADLIQQTRLLSNRRSDV